ncbi:glucose-methanol-choline oxidoreductase, FAD/NAD(P)-binding domain protein [Tanacetum coccineum]|uniref:Glucose-methanol-choline oxidoreductase, FAD/NAD(P)-binding domain protein n=1 Tax=Tanacetum coccineum TaxID=301880 RepID=A0ABQ5D810_9ASTR
MLQPFFNFFLKQLQYSAYNFGMNIHVPEEDSDSLLSHRTILSECFGSDADHFSNDTGNPNDYIGLKINDMLTANSNMMNEDSECNGSLIMAGDIIHFNTVNLLELSDLETSENHSAVKDLSAEVIEENISTVIVNDEYKVLGVNSLRVIDGSTFLNSPGTHPQASVLMLGS